MQRYDNDTKMCLFTSIHRPWGFGMDVLVNMTWLGVQMMSTGTSWISNFSTGISSTSWQSWTVRSHVLSDASSCSYTLKVGKKIMHAEVFHIHGFYCFIHLFMVWNSYLEKGLLWMYQPKSSFVEGTSKSDLLTVMQYQLVLEYRFSFPATRKGI